MGNNGLCECVVCGSLHAPGAQLTGAAQARFQADNATRKLAGIILPVIYDEKTTSVYDKVGTSSEQWLFALSCAPGESVLEMHQRGHSIAECLNSYEQVLAERDALLEMCSKVLGVQLVGNIAIIANLGGVFLGCNTATGEHLTEGRASLLDAYNALKSEVKQDAG